MINYHITAYSINLLFVKFMHYLIITNLVLIIIYSYSYYFLFIKKILQYILSLKFSALFNNGLLI